MPTLRQLRGTPNILIVGSKSIYLSDEDYREKLKRYLHAQTERTSPVYEGSHDFWVTYPTPALPGHGPNHDWEDMDVGPRPLRGIVEMSDIPLRDGLDTTGDLYRTALADEMDTLLQEVGHHWLVPGDMQFQTSRGDVKPTEVHKLVRALNKRYWPTSPTLMGRDNRHWSVYTQTEDSPFDGQAYKRSEDDHQRDLWVQTPTTQRAVHPRFNGAVGTIHPLSAYSDLDLLVMGVLTPEQAYRNQHGRFYWLHPQWTRPLPYFIGLFVAFDTGQYYYFGYDQHHDAIGVTGTDGYYTRQNLPTQYYPIGTYGMVLRVVRRGNRYHFQARADYRYAHSDRDSVHHLFEELNFLPAPNTSIGWDEFNTIARPEISGEPIAIGLVVRRENRHFLAEGRFFNFELQDANGQQTWRFEKVPPVRSGQVEYSTLTEGNLFYHRLAKGPLATTRNHRLYVNAPFARLDEDADGGFRTYPHFDIVSDDDRAPRIVVRPAAGDFVFGSSVKVARTIMPPWAGGDIGGRQMIGTAHSLRTENVIIPDSIRDKQNPPPDNTYKVAFIVVVQDADKVPDTFIEQLDIVRRYWGATFYESTRHHRRMYSRLKYVARG